LLLFQALADVCPLNSEESQQMKNIPVVSSFLENSLIGTLTINEEMLPAGAGWHFAIGYKILETDGHDATMIDLISISPVCDERFSRDTLPKKNVHDGWMPIDTAPKMKKVIVGYYNKLGNWRSVMAMYYAPGTLELLDDVDDTDDGYAPEGWYELCENAETIGFTDERLRTGCQRRPVHLLLALIPLDRWCALEHLLDDLFGKPLAVVDAVGPFA
jgi:hypothetical protein